MTETVPCTLIETLELLRCNIYLNNHQEGDCVGLFTHGTAVFYLPEFPFSGEVESSNLLLALDSFKHFENIGAVSPLHNVVVVTPNDRLVSNSELLNDYYLQKMEQYGVEVRYGQKLTAIDKGKSYLTQRQVVLQFGGCQFRGTNRTRFPNVAFVHSKQSQCTTQKLRIIGHVQK